MKKMFIAVLASMVLMPCAVFAHPESGLIPDAIAEIEYAIVLDINPKDTFTRNKLAVVLLRKDKIKEAETEFQKVLKISPDDFDAYDGMGLVRAKERKLDEAIEWFKKAIALSVEDTMVHYHMGNAYEELGDYINSKKYYEKALEVNDMLIGKGLNVKEEEKKRELIKSALKNIKTKISKK